MKRSLSGALGKCHVAACIVLTALSLALPVSALSPRPADRAEQLKKIFAMEVLPKESGYISILGRSAHIVTEGRRRLPAQSQIYYMLTEDRPINFLHWLKSDDTHILIEGGPVEYYIFCPNGRADLKVLGSDFGAGQRPLVAIPAGCWKALRLQKGARFALMANVLTPAWGEDRVKIGESRQWITRFTGSAPWATPDFLRTLIGPNLLPDRLPASEAGGAR